MFARISTVGLIATVALSLPADPAPYYTLESTGALRLAAAGDEARVGLVPEPVNGRPVLEISLGATRGQAALVLLTYADQELRPGRYPVGPSMFGLPSAGRRFHPCFIAGTVERPLGFFHGETGWVTVTSVANGRITGEYEIRARGFLADDMEDEQQWVTVRGTFGAAADSTALSLRAVSAVAR